MLRRCLLAFAFMNVLSLLAAAQQTAGSQPPVARDRPTCPRDRNCSCARWTRNVLQPCTLAWIDNTALACDVFIPATGLRRVVYPIASVASVTQQFPDTRTGNHIVALCVGMAIGGTAGGILASEGGVRAGFTGAALGSVVGGALALAATNSFTPRPQPLFSLRVPLRTPRLPVGRRRF